MKNTPNFSEYKYDSNDCSILLPYLENYIEFFLKFIPQAIPANFISIISCLFLWLALITNLFFREIFSFSELVIFSVLCVHLYTVGDLLDGRQARRTGTSSPLGTYMDHSLDAINACLMMGINIALFSVSEIWLQVLPVFFSTSAFLFVQVEENITKQIFLDKFGNIEALFLIKFIYLLLLIPEVRLFFDESYWFGLKNYFWLIGFLGISSIVTISGSIKRMKQLPRNLIVFLSFYAIFSYALTQYETDPVLIWFLLAAFVSEYVAEVVFANIGCLQLPRFSLLHQVAILLYLVLHQTSEQFPEVSSVALSLLYAYFIGAFVVMTGIRMFSMRKMWLWKNPKGQSV